MERGAPDAGQQGVAGVELEGSEVDESPDVVGADERLGRGDPSVGMGDNDNGTLDRSSSGGRDRIRIRVHVTQCGRVVAGSGEANRAHVNVRQFGDQCVHVLGLVPSAGYEEECGLRAHSGPKKLDGICHDRPRALAAANAAEPVGSWGGHSVCAVPNADLHLRARIRIRPCPSVQALRCLRYRA